MCIRDSSSGAEDAHQIFTPGSVLGKARKFDSEISPTPPLIFTCLLYTSDAADDLLCVDLRGA